MAQNLLRGAAFAAALVFFASEAGAEAPSEGAGFKPVRVGVAEQLTAIVGLVAGEKKFFSAEGVPVELTYFVSGSRALQAMAAGEIDIAIGVADVPFALRAFQMPDLVILGIVGADARLRKIVARKSAGIMKIEDLRGKRIGTQENSAVHFFLHIFLNYAGLKPQEVTMSFFLAEDLPGALAEKKVDAISMREPFLSRAEKMLGEDTVFFEVPDLYYSYEVMVTRGNLVRDRPETLQRVMNAVNRAADFVKANPREAVSIGARALAMDEKDFRRDFFQIKTGLFFDQGLFLTLEDVSRWAVQNGMAENGKAPPYETMINLSFLEALGPHRLSEFDAP